MVASESPPPRRRRGPVFRPRFTLMVLYFALLFVGLSLLLVVPDLISAYQQLPPGPEELTPEELAMARDVASAAIRGKLVYTFVGSVGVVGVLTWLGRLPGMREPRVR